MERTEPPGGSEALAAYIARHGIDAALVRPGVPTPTVAHAAAALGVEPRQIVKSIVFEGKRTPCVAVAIVAGDGRVDRAKVAAVLALPVLKLARPETVQRFIGFAVGGVPPVGHAERVPVVVDRRVLQHEVVFGGGGDEHHMLRILPADIVRLAGAVVADVVQPDDQRPFDDTPIPAVGQ